MMVMINVMIRSNRNSLTAVDEMSDALIPFFSSSSSNSLESSMRGFKVYSINTAIGFRLGDNCMDVFFSNSHISYPI